MTHFGRRSAAAAVVGVLLFLPQSAAAAPYTADASVSASTSNPDVGVSFTVSVNGFAPAELVDVELHSTVVLLATIQTDGAGSGTAVVTAPSDFRCEHFITATGRSSGRVARTDLVIGSASSCAGTGNSGYGNSGTGNSGYGNSGTGNSGYRNSGTGNSGYRNSGTGNDFLSTAGVGEPDPPRLRSGEAVALAALALGLVGASGALYRGRRA